VIEFSDAFSNSNITAIFSSMHTERRSVYPCDDTHSAVQCAEREWERESGARKMNFLFVARWLDSLYGNFEGTSSHLTRHVTCVPYPYGRSRSSPKRN